MAFPDSFRLSTPDWDCAFSHMVLSVSSRRRSLWEYSNGLLSTNLLTPSLINTHISSVLGNPDSYKDHTNLLDLGTDEKKNKIGFSLSFRYGMWFRQLDYPALGYETKEGVGFLAVWDM